MSRIRTTFATAVFASTFLAPSSSSVFAANLSGEQKAQFDTSIPAQDVAPAPTPSPPTAGRKGKMLEGRAQQTAVKDQQFRAWQASQFYGQGALALDRKDYRLAADLFKRAGEGFDMEGYEKFFGQARFAEAQCRRLLGQTDRASKLYQGALETFNEYDPLSPYQKAALDNLKKVSPKLAAQVDRDQARLKMLMVPMKIMRVDRNVVLKGGLSDFGSSRLLAQKGTADVATGEINNTMHKAFVKMICLETAELGSTYATAENRWYPLIANGKTVAISASSDFLTPSISVKINERFCNVSVELPGIGSTKRTVFMLTDGNHIVAIEPNSGDMWTLEGDFKSKEPSFSWKKFNHIHSKSKHKQS